MQTKKIVILAVYLGKLPNNHRLFVESIRQNPSIDFRIFTDQTIVSEAPNLQYIKITLTEIDALIKTKINPKYKIKAPYKCCDYKPLYGVLFEDYVKGYDYWGFCDLDVIFGDIRGFITRDILEKYDKILSFGHLSLFRNINTIYEEYIRDKYDDVFECEKNRFFDESGINNIYRDNNLRLYDKKVFADISIMRKRFTLTDGKNYPNQVFYWEKGHVYRAFEIDGDIKRDEFIYIHFKQRGYLEDLVKDNYPSSFYICDAGFIDKKPGLPSLNEIKKHNHYTGKLKEALETRVRSFRNRVRFKFDKRF